MRCSVDGCNEKRYGKRPKCKDHYNEEHRLWSQQNAHRIRNTNLKQNYGISLDEYEVLLAAQQGVCAICGKPEEQIHYSTGVPKNLAVDHDHNSGAIRGLLCGHCNNLLGAADDDIEVLEAAIEYLRVR